nr:hypothetical protein [Tanacetum cinerariifolium]
MKEIYTRAMQKKIQRRTLKSMQKPQRDQDGKPRYYMGPRSFSYSKTNPTKDIHNNVLSHGELLDPLGIRGRRGRLIEADLKVLNDSGHWDICGCSYF